MPWEFFPERKYITARNQAVHPHQKQDTPELFFGNPNYINTGSLFRLCTDLLAALGGDFQDLSVCLVISKANIC